MQSSPGLASGISFFPQNCLWSFVNGRSLLSFGHVSSSEISTREVSNSSGASAPSSCKGLVDMIMTKRRAVLAQTWKKLLAYYIGDQRSYSDSKLPVSLASLSVSLVLLWTGPVRDHISFISFAMILICL